MEKNELFETMPIKKAVMKMSIPLMTSLLVTVIYNMADTFFIGQTGGCQPSGSSKFNYSNIYVAYGIK